MGFGGRGFLFMGVLLALPLASYWYVFRPQNTEIDRARKEIEQKEQMLKKLEFATSQTADLERTNKEIAEGIALNEARIPSTKEVDVVLDQVATIARESKLTIPKIKAQPMIATSKFKEQPLEMTVTGDGDDFYEFLLRIEKLQRITRILDMKLERSEDTNGAIEAQFTLSIYFQTEEQGRTS